MSNTISIDKGNGQESPKGESTITLCGVNYQLLEVMLLKQPNGQILVAVDHNQLRTMASETVNAIEWLLATMVCTP